MSKKTVPIQLSSNRIIYVEVEEVDIEIPNRTIVQGEKKVRDVHESAELTGMREKIGEYFTQVLQNNISAVVEMTEKSLEKYSPKEWSVEINIGLQGKADFPLPVILGAQAQGAIKVIARWYKDAVKQ